MKIKPCSCGSIPEIYRIGNEYTKSRGAEIYCKGCQRKKVVKVKTKSIDWAVEKAIEVWNNRPREDELLEALEKAVYAIKYEDNFVQMSYFQDLIEKYRSEV